MGKMKLAEEVEFSATSVDFLFSLPASVELEGGVFSEYHCNLYFAEVKQISCSGRIHLLWHPRSTSDSWLTQHPQQLTLLTAPFPPSFLLWEPPPPLSSPPPGQVQPLRPLPLLTFSWGPVGLPAPSVLSVSQQGRILLRMPAVVASLSGTCLLDRCSHRRMFSYLIRTPAST